MGCGLSTRLNPEDAATLSHGRMMSSSDGHITDINSPATSKHHDRGGDDSVLSFAQWSQKSGSSTQGKDAKQVGEGGEKEGEKEEEDYQSEVLIFPRSPSFRVYCIASSNSSRSHSFISDNDSASSVKNNGDEDSTNKPTEEKKERKKKERRTRGLRSALQKGMPRRKKNLLSFGCYTSHASYDEKPL
ncbi:uncharacterized protein LOC114753077 [Neltuma alba]|uniref:uncharacterized protein LOC114736532 n=1 Tax=Neltuma alba TaxID=207710 RepID=UPI0010A47225|nr:uncharacterized protein LOC114736532 [Prosopis alba]XP_028797576.1 uncharacterized protein LOC114753077 [Prosopis alba]